MLQIQIANLTSSWDRWLCPQGTQGKLEDLQNRRIAHFLIMMALLGVPIVILSVRSVASAAISLIGTLAMVGVIIVLSRWQHVRLAAWLCIIVAMLMISFNTISTLTPIMVLAQVTAMAFPIVTAGTVFGARTCFAVAAFGTGLLLITLQMHSSLAPLPLLDQSRGYIAPLLYMTCAIALGLRGFQRALRAADRTEELSALNQQLAALLQESEATRQELHLVMDTMLESLMIFDAQGELRYINRAGREYLGKDLEGARQSTQQPVRMTDMHGHVINPEEYPIAQTLKGVSTHSPTTVRCYFPQQKMVIYSMRTAPLPAADGTIQGAILTIRDITRQTQHQQHLEILRAVAHICALGATELSITTDVLRLLVDKLHLGGAIIVMLDHEREGYARISGHHFTDTFPEVVREQHHQRVTTNPISPVANSTALRTIATGVASFDAPILEAEEFHLSTVPLCRDEKIWGALVCCYEPSQLLDPIVPDFLASIAEEIVGALQRTVLYEEARQMTYLDPLTGLHNHRAFQDMLHHQVATCTAANLPLALVTVDIDEFRYFNAHYGHQNGDRALRMVADCIRHMVRDGEFAARYGGEEFAIILPTMGMERAAELSQLILQAVAQEYFEVTTSEDAEPDTTMLTVSVGYAVFPIHASAGSSLVKAAELALHTAKRAGRNLAVGYNTMLLEETMPLFSANTAQMESEVTLPTGADLEAVQALVAAIDLRDGYTAAHSEGVSRYAVAIARAMHLSTEQVETLRLGGYVHDVGKIGVPDNVLRKPGKLTDEEWIAMRAHTTMGEAIVGRMEQLRHLLPLVRWHHERLDGSGYPDGLSGNAIPLLVRVLAVADVFEAFTAERPYHPGRTAMEGLMMLRREVQTGKMDENIVEHFARILFEQGIISAESAGERDILDAA